MMKKVMVMGTFDLLHKGHESFLRQAKKHGDYLVVLIARDKTVERLKGRKVFTPERTRQKNVMRTGIPDKVILGSLGDKYAAIEKEHPDVICLGYDQTFFTDALRTELNNRGLNTKLIRLKPFKPKVYKTSLIAKRYLYDGARK